MRIILLGLGTFLGIFVIIKFVQGKKFNAMVEPLEGDAWPLSDFYTLGLAMEEMKLFSFRGKLKEKLVSQAKLLYDPQYAEYYALMVWAQMLSYSILVLTIAVLFAALVNSAGVIFFGIIVLVVFDYYFYTVMKNQLEERKQAFAIELPEIVSTMAMLINSGMMLRDAWKVVAFNKNGPVYDLMKNSVYEMENGIPEKDAIYRFGTLSNSQDTKKFVSMLTQGMDSGSRDLSTLLIMQSSEMWNLKKQVMLQKGKAAESKLLIPTVMIFGGIIVIVVVAAVSLLL